MNPRDHRTQRGEDKARDHGLGRSGQIESQNQFQLGNRRHQIAFVQPPRFVIDVNDSVLSAGDIAVGASHQFADKVFDIAADVAGF